MMNIVEIAWDLSAWNCTHCDIKPKIKYCSQ